MNLNTATATHLNTIHLFFSGHRELEMGAEISIPSVSLPAEFEYSIQLAAIECQCKISSSKYTYIVASNGRYVLSENIDTALIVVRISDANQVIKSDLFDPITMTLIGIVIMSAANF